MLDGTSLFCQWEGKNVSLLHSCNSVPDSLSPFLNVNVFEAFISDGRYIIIQQLQHI